MQNVMTELFKSFTATQVNSDGTAVAFNDDCVVLFRLIPEKEQYGISKWMPGVFHANPAFKGRDLARDPNGPLLVSTSFTENECRLFEVGHQNDGENFTSLLHLEVRNPEEHACITASEKFAQQLLEKLQAFCATHPDFISDSIAITDQNPGRNQLITFHKDQVSIQIPHCHKHDSNWLSYIHLDLKDNTFYYNFYDEVDGEHFTIPQVWGVVDIDKAGFTVDALIENPALPRNKNGILY